jgi:N-acetyl-anhydromuramyl-L-alanine amidase AmpD
MEIKLGDFGLATKIEFEGEKKKTICGTPNYIAPEILEGKTGHSYEVDIWSLGVTFYQMLFGEHPYYAEIHTRKVSAHFLIRRDGEIIQFVSCLERAWHAGISSWQGHQRCNDFSIGIELEGSDFEAFEPKQYLALIGLVKQLKKTYPIEHIVGHSDIAPGRKTDPGPYFDWSQLETVKI